MASRRSASRTDRVFGDPGVILQVVTGGVFGQTAGGIFGAQAERAGVKRMKNLARGK